MNKTQVQTHTPTPWTCIPTGTQIYKGKMPLCVMQYGAGDQEEARANAAHIVRCVNAHEGLVKSLEQAITDIEELRDRLEADGHDTGDWEINLHDFKQALDHAKGESHETDTSRDR